MNFKQFEDQFYFAYMIAHDFVDIKLKDHTHIYANKYEYQSKNFVRVSYDFKGLPYELPCATINLESVDEISSPRGD